MHTVLQDIRFGARLLLKNIMPTVLALLSLGLAIGAATAIFSVVHGALIDPFPYKDTRHMWVLRIMNAKGSGGREPNTAEYQDIVKLPDVQDALATGFGDVLVNMGAGPESIRGVQMSGNAFSFLGVKPLLGRTNGPQDIHPGGEPEHVVVLSDAQWQRLFGGDRNVFGRTMRINDEPYTVVGVMPPRFTWFGRESSWLPLGMDRKSRQMVTVRLRLQPGVSQQAAMGALHRLFLNLAREFPKDFPKEGFQDDADPLHGYDGGQRRFADQPLHPAERGGIAAAHRVRECCQSPTGASDGAAEGDRSTAFAWGRTRPADPAVAHREHRAGLGGRSARRGAGVLGFEIHGVANTGFLYTERGGDLRQRLGTAFLDPGLHVHRHSFRPRSRAACIEAGLERFTQGCAGAHRK